MAGLEYLDFDLAVEATPTPGTYQVSVLASPRGEASGQMVFPFNADALENVILKLGRTRTGVRSLGSPTQGVAEKFGGDLFDALFAGEVGSRFESSLDEASDEGKGLRIRLRLGRAPQLADVPWEYLYWASRRRFLVLSSKTPVVRYLEQPRSVTPLLVSPPLQVLLVVSSPTDLATLNVGAEVQRVTGALAGLEASGQVHVTVLQTASLAELSRALRQARHPPPGPCPAAPTACSAPGSGPWPHPRPCPGPHRPGRPRRHRRPRLRPSWGWPARSGTA